MGLLDNLTNLNPEQTQGLLAAAAQMLQMSGPSRTPTSFGQALGGGLSAYQQATQAAQKQRMDQQEAEQMRQLRDLQIRSTQGDLAAKDALRQMQQRIQSRLKGEAVGTPAMPQAAQQFADSMPPLGGTPQASAPAPAAAMPQPQVPGGVPPAMGGAAAQMGQGLTQSIVQRLQREAQVRAEEGDIDGADKALANAAKFLPEVKDIRVGTQGGKPVQVITYKDGSEQVSQFGVAPKIHFADNGQRTAIPIDEYTGMQLPGQNGIQRQQSPESVASTASAAASRAQAERHYQGGRVPAGFRMAADGTRMEPIPGGPADIGKALPGSAVKELEAAGTAVENTRRLRDTFKNKYGGKTIIGGLSNAAGRIFGDDTGQAQWWQDMDAQQNITRNQLFGSALTATELQAWEKTSINPRMDAKQIRENLQRRTEIEERAASKLGRAYTAGGYNKTQIGELLGTASEFVTKAAPPAGARPQTNSKGWRLMTDANGNNAYVSPDGRQYEEVK